MINESLTSQHGITYHVNYDMRKLSIVGISGNGAIWKEGEW